MFTFREITGGQLIWYCRRTLVKLFLQVCLFPILSYHDKKIAPKGANDIKLINTGKILENDKMVGQCIGPFGDLSKAVITMHVVAQPSVAKVKTEKEEDGVPRKNLYPCSIL
ncbi:Membrane-anchored ubiquitin-fold protein 3 [Gossypium arboreum]|uniref:Membrane-anchored ubiquitin-fold protein 3 n=1 Tax=Gossypium arboreum TaxID=29729 RepID=A0A0B0MGQ8_GOSAR|nr:Membrane-anchored ubiquitin-fold protein 3 [Gossypium arboreum]